MSEIKTVTLSAIEIASDPNMYQAFTKSTAIYPKDEALWYTTLGLVGEAGEIANKVKKVIRDKGGIPTDSDKLEIAKEIGDVMWYVARLADELGVPLLDLILDNVKKLSSRKERGVIGGSGDNR